MAFLKNNQSKQVLSVLVLALTVAALFLYGVPVVGQVFNGISWSSLGDLSADGWVVPVLRSTLFGCVTVVLEIGLGFLIAVGMLDQRGADRTHWTAILLLPLLMGSTSTAFLFKIAIFDSSIITPLIQERRLAPTWTLMIALQLWQYLPPFAYMFYVRLLSMARSRVDFANAASLSTSERLCDFHWPHCRSLAGLLALFGVADGIHEYAKFSSVLRASPGTSTELISHRLQRYYESWRLVDARVAAENTLAFVAITTILALLVSLFVAWIVCRLMDTLVKSFRSASAVNRIPSIPARALRVFLILVVLVPVAYLCRYLSDWHFIDASAFLRSALLSLVALATTIVVVIPFSFSVRLLWPDLLRRFDNRSLPFFGALYALHVVPSIGIAFCGYYWLARIDIAARGQIFVILIWLCAQAIIAFPLLASFVVVANFRVSCGELGFQNAANASWLETLSNSFLGRLKPEYFLVVLFGFSIIWNESVLNATMSTLSRNISSIAVEISQRVNGRSAAYSEAAWTIVAAMVPIAFWLVLWMSFMRRSETSRIG